MHNQHADPPIARFNGQAFHRRVESCLGGAVVDILAAVKRTAIPKPHDLGFCFLAPAAPVLLCSGHQVAPQTDTASPAAKIFLLALTSRSW